MAGILSTLLGSGAAGASRGILSDPLNLNSTLAPMADQERKTNPLSVLSLDPANAAGPTPQIDLSKPYANIDGATGAYSDLLPKDVTLPTNTPDYHQQEIDKKDRQKALLQFGIGMLSGNGFFDGLSKGLQGYQTTMDAQEERRKGKTIPVNGGTHLMHIDDNGNVTFQQTPVAQYGLDKAELAGNIKERYLTRQGEIRSAERKDDRQFHRENLMMQLEAQARERQADREARAELARQEAQYRLDAAQSRGTNVPPKAMSDYTSFMDIVGESKTSNDQLARVDQLLNSGNLDFSGPSNLYNEAAISGWAPPTEGSRAYGEFKQTVKGLQNTLLMLNKGVQTDGDADRAMDQIIAGKGDAETIRRNLKVIRESIERRMDIARQKMHMYEQTYGIPSADGFSASDGYDAPPVRAAPSPQKSFQGWSIKR